MAVVNAAAEAACPDGNDEEVGRLVSLRAIGTRSAAGLRRGNRVLPIAFALKLAPAMATTPRNAALRVIPFRVASTPAIANHSSPWFAVFVSRFKPASAEVRGRFALFRTSFSSIRPTRIPDLRTRLNTR